MFSALTQDHTYMARAAYRLDRVENEIPENDFEAIAVKQQRRALALELGIEFEPRASRS